MDTQTPDLRQRSLCVTGRATAIGRRASPPSPTPIWSSCASTRWQRPDAAAALDGPAAAGDRHVPAAWEGGHVRGIRRGAPAHPAEALALGAEFVDVEWDARFDVSSRRATARRRALAPRFRRRAGATCRRARTRCARPAPKSSSSRSRRASLTDLRAAARATRTARRAAVLIGMGRVRPRRRASWPDASARAGPTRATGRAGPGDRVAAARRVPLPPHPAATPRSTASSAARCALGVAGDAQRGVRGAGIERRLPAARGIARHRRLPRCSAGASACSGASVTIPFKLDVSPLLDEVDAAGGRGRRRQHDRDRDGRWIGDEHRRRGLPGAAAQAACRRFADVRAARSRRRRRGARGRRFALQQRRCAGRLAARRPEAAEAVATRWVRRRPLAARAGSVGSAGQRHAGRRSAAQRGAVPLSASPARRPACLRPGLQPGPDGLDARRRGAPAVGRSAASRCWSRRRSEQFEWWTGSPAARRPVARGRGRRPSESDES